MGPLRSITTKKTRDLILMSTLSPRATRLALMPLANDNAESSEDKISVLKQC